MLFRYSITSKHPKLCIKHTKLDDAAVNPNHISLTTSKKWAELWLQNKRLRLTTSQFDSSIHVTAKGLTTYPQIADVGILTLNSNTFSFLFYLCIDIGTCLLLIFHFFLLAFFYTTLFIGWRLGHFIFWKQQQKKRVK